MTTTEIQIAIAKLMGWRFSGHPTADEIMKGWSMPHTFAIHHKTGKPVSINSIPNYPTSLDACREFEQDAPAEYWNNLQWQSIGGRSLVGPPMQMAIRMCKATPVQRCEAFLRLHNQCIEKE